MAQLSTKPPDRAGAEVRPKEPSVLVILVTSNGARWLRECLLALSRQTHPRLGVVAVDGGSTDGSREVLERALGPGRVVSLPDNPGLPSAVQAVLSMDVAERADYVLILHDDAALEPDAVSRLVEAAQRIEGVGVVGPKVVDWADPRILRDVGQSTDRFAYPYTPLEEGEIDQGQYDRVREVLFVSSTAMLVSREAWQRAGPPDERFAPYYEDLDFCWRARLAGFRVLMSPSARVRHLAATVRGERGQPDRPRPRYQLERASLAALLKNYGAFSLMWILPLYMFQGLGKAVLWTLTRRFDETVQLFAAWGWNLAHLPSTFRRRARAQSVRRVPDRVVRRYMAPLSSRIRRWTELVGRAMGRAETEGEGEAERPLEEQEELELPSIGKRTVSLARAHPVGTAWIVLTVIALLAYRPLFGHEVLAGGVLPAFPSNAGGFFHELLSGVQTTGLGGTQAASPALAVLGALSGVLFGSTQLALKAMLIVLPPLAALSFYRAFQKEIGSKSAAVVAAACYGLSPLLLWGFSQGRLGLLVAIAAFPALASRMAAPFEPVARRMVRFIVEAAVILAVAIAFFPGVVLAVALLAIATVASPGAGGYRIRGAIASLAALAVAAVLLFPLAMDLITGGGAAMGSTAGRPEFGPLVRLAAGPAPGSWPVAWFLPIAAVVGFSLTGPDRSRTLRYLVAGVAAPFLAWASAAGYLPASLSNPPAYLLAGALADCALVAHGLASAQSVGRRSFGYPQIAGVALASLLGGGLLLQGVRAAQADWEIGPGTLPPAWPVVTSSPGPSDFRVLWLGRRGGDPFPAPGGDAAGTVTAGNATLRYAVTDAGGVSALDLGRAARGPGYGYLENVLSDTLSGTTGHAGALLGTLGVKFVVSAEGDLPTRAFDRLDHQVDLDLVPAGGLIIFRNVRALPPAWTGDQQQYVEAARASTLAPIVSLPPSEVSPLRRVSGGIEGTTHASKAAIAVLAQQFSADWRLQQGGRVVQPFRAFGWATGFPVSPGEGRVVVRYGQQWVRTLEVSLLALLWLVALWMTRKPARPARR